MATDRRADHHARSNHAHTGNHGTCRRNLPGGLRRGAPGDTRPRSRVSARGRARGCRGDRSAPGGVRPLRPEGRGVCCRLRGAVLRGAGGVHLRDAEGHRPQPRPSQRLRRRRHRGARARPSQPGRERPHEPLRGGGLGGGRRRACPRARRSQRLPARPGHPHRLRGRHARRRTRGAHHDLRPLGGRGAIWRRRVRAEGRQVCPGLLLPAASTGASTPSPSTGSRPTPTVFSLPWNAP